METKLMEIREQLKIPFSRIKGQSFWEGDRKKIVIIGSGIGGMASGALFAKIGHHVTVLEANKSLIGGHARCPTFHGMRFSMGPQYVWEFGNGCVGDRFLRFLGLKDTCLFKQMNTEGFERIFIGNNTGEGHRLFVDFMVPMGLENFRQKLILLFPEERAKLDPLFDDMIAIFNTYKSSLMHHVSKEGIVFSATKFLLAGNIPLSIKLKVGRAAYQTLEIFFDQYEINNLLRRILYGHGGIFAENESELSAIAYIIGTGNYHTGAWYPEKGFFHFFDSLSGVIKNADGAVMTGKKVSRLETQNDHVKTAICEDGSMYECDFVFSDISPRLTFELLGKDTEIFDYSLSPSIPACCIGVKGLFPGIADMKGANYWWQDGSAINYRDPDIKEAPRMLFVGSPTANGFGGKEGSPDHALVIFFPGNYLQEAEIYKHGTDAVRRFKDKLAVDVVDILDKNIFPGIKSKILFAEIISSIDIESDTGGEFGNAYGRRMSVDEIFKVLEMGDACPENLYNVSATKNRPGIAGGIITASLLLEELTGKTL